MPSKPTPEDLRGLVVRIRATAREVAEHVARAESYGAFIPTGVYTVQPTLLTWARRLEQGGPQ